MGCGQSKTNASGPKVNIQKSNAPGKRGNAKQGLTRQTTGLSKRTPLSQRLTKRTPLSSKLSQKKEEGEKRDVSPVRSAPRSSKQSFPRPIVQPADQKSQGSIIMSRPVVMPVVSPISPPDNNWKRREPSQGSNKWSKVKALGVGRKDNSSPRKSGSIFDLRRSQSPLKQRTFSDLDMHQYRNRESSQDIQTNFSIKITQGPGSPPSIDRQQSNASTVLSVGPSASQCLVMSPKSSFAGSAVSGNEFLRSAACSVVSGVTNATRMSDLTGMTGFTRYSEFGRESCLSGADTMLSAPQSAFLNSERDSVMSGAEQSMLSGVSAFGSHLSGSNLSAPGSMRSFKGRGRPSSTVGSRPNMRTLRSVAEDKEVEDTKRSDRCSGRGDTPTCSDDSSEAKGQGPTSVISGMSSFSKLSNLPKDKAERALLKKNLQEKLRNMKNKAGKMIQEKKWLKNQVNAHKGGLPPMARKTIEDPAVESFVQKKVAEVLKQTQEIGLPQEQVDMIISKVVSEVKRTMKTENGSSSLGRVPSLPTTGRLSRPGTDSSRSARSALSRGFKLGVTVDRNRAMESDSSATDLFGEQYEAFYDGPAPTIIYDTDATSLIVPRGSIYSQEENGSAISTLSTSHSRITEFSFLPTSEEGERSRSRRHGSGGRRHGEGKERSRRHRE